MGDYELAPYPLTVPQESLPDGEFLLPVCITRERLLEMMAMFKLAEVYSGLNIDGKIDVLEALAYVENPCDSPCMPDCGGEEDTIADNIADFVNGVIDNFQEGGIVGALGYVIEELGRIVIETTIKVVSTTVYAVGVAGIIYILVNGIPVESVNILPNEVIELIYDTGTNSSKIIEFVYEVAA